MIEKSWGDASLRSGDFVGMEFSSVLFPFISPITSLDLWPSAAPWGYKHSSLRDAKIL